MSFVHPPGTHSATVTGAYLADSRFGRPAVILNLTTAHGDLKLEAELDGKHFKDTLAGLRGAGWKDGGLEAAPAQVMGNQLQVDVRHKAGNNGKIFVNVYMARPGGAGGGAAAPYDPARAKAVADSLKARIAAVESGQSDGGGRGEVPPMAPIDPDDVPFLWLITVGLSLAAFGSGAFTFIA